MHQAAEQSEAGAVWKVVEGDSETDGEDFCVVKEEDGSVEGGMLEGDMVEGDMVEGDMVEGDMVEGDMVEGDLAEDPRSKAVHRLPCLSPLSNLHDDLTP
jgi:hypothetical protein